MYHLLAGSEERHGHNSNDGGGGAGAGAGTYVHDTDTDTDKDSGGSRTRTVSKLSTYAVTYLHALDCRIGARAQQQQQTGQQQQQRQGEGEVTEPLKELPACDPAHAEDDAGHGAADQQEGQEGQEQSEERAAAAGRVAQWRRAREAWLLRVAASEPSLLSSSHETCL